MQAKRWAVVMVCTAMLLVGTVVGAGQARAASSISGHVYCTDGQAVEGVWVAANSGGSGWASWGVAGSTDYAWFSYTLPNGGSYSVHVGCGGSPSRWNTANYSVTVSASGYEFWCWDNPNDGSLYRTCTV